MPETIHITGLPAAAILAFAAWGVVSTTLDLVGYFIARSSHRPAAWR